MRHAPRPRRTQVRVDGALRARAHHAGDPQDDIRCARFSAIANASRAIGIADHLRQALAVAQVDEDHAAVVAAAVRPAGAASRVWPTSAALDLAAVVGAHLAVIVRCRGGTTPIEMMYFSAWSTRHVELDHVLARAR